MSRERVTQGVRRDPLGTTGTARRLLDHSPCPDPGERPATGVEKQPPAPLPPIERGPDLAAVQRPRPQRSPPHRHEPLLGTLPEQPRDAVLEQHVLLLD